MSTVSEGPTIAIQGFLESRGTHKATVIELVGPLKIMLYPPSAAPHAETTLLTELGRLSVSVAVPD